MDIQSAKENSSTLYTVSNSKMSFSAYDFGCTIKNIMLPETDGGFVDVLLGYDDLDGFKNGTESHNAVIGRFANRIAGGKFEIDGKTFFLDKNAGENCLHGGFTRFDKMQWNSKPFKTGGEAGIEFTRTSPDGEQGFPGNLTMKVVYSLNEKNELSITYAAQTDKATVINLTNHAYFNLSGNGSVLNHELVLDSKKILENDENSIPTGMFLEVAGTAFDFTNRKKIGRDIGKIEYGYDNCFVTKAYETKRLEKFGTLYDGNSSRTLEIFTDRPGVHVYTANWIQGIKGKNGVVHNKHDGICFETENFPDAPNHDGFPESILRPGQIFRSKTVYKFSF